MFGSIESINKVGKTLKCEPPFSEDETALFTIKASGNFQTVATLYSSRTPAGLKNQTQLPCRHIVMYKDEDGKTKGIMLHNIDVEMLMDDYSPNATVSAILDGSNEDDQGMPINEYGIFTISNNDVVCEHYITEEDSDINAFKNTYEFQQLVVEAKLFNGELVLTQDEHRVFSQSLDESKKALARIYY